MLKGLLFFALFGGFAYAITDYLIHSERFLVKTIRVEGAKVLSEEAIRAVAGVTRADNVFLCDAEAARVRVEAMPYVKRCAILRSYPDKVTIRVEERAAEATLLVNNHAFLLDAEAVVLREVDPLDPYVSPLITNVPDLGFVEPGQCLTSAPLRQALDVWHAFASAPLSAELTLSEISAPAVGYISLYCDELPYEIRCGRGGLVRQFQYFEVLWQEKGGELPCVEYLDLRFDNSLVCK